LSPEAITEEKISASLYTAGLPDPDLIIRTSGEQRISNFLLWQSAYAEFVFVDENWPDFDEASFVRVLETFSLRDRRFGGIGAVQS
jgi:undecaprenyl diphosphate synthase